VLAGGGCASVRVTPTPDVVSCAVEVAAVSMSNQLGDPLMPTYGVLDELMIRIADRDEESFALLYGYTRRMLSSAVLSIVGDRSRAEEVAQDAYLTAWLKAADFDPSKGTAITWLLTLARRRAIDNVRSHVSSVARDRRDIQHHVVATRDIVSEQAQLNADTQRMHAAMQMLPALQREAISLAFLHHRTHAQIAEQLGVPLGTVKSRIRDGLRKMRGNLT
jgi:RNA polymerase sigma-70 factor (ECF subfamily)